MKHKSFAALAVLLLVSLLLVSCGETPVEIGEPKKIELDHIAITLTDTFVEQEADEVFIAEFKRGETVVSIEEDSNADLGNAGFDYNGTAHDFAQSYVDSVGANLFVEDIEGLVCVGFLTGGEGYVTTQHILWFYKGTDAFFIVHCTVPQSEYTEDAYNELVKFGKSVVVS